MTWFVIGAVLGAIQLAVSHSGTTTRQHSPILFVLFGALIGAGIYGTILWAVLDQWLGVRL